MQELSALVRKQGYRLTPQRRAILEVIGTSREHLSPADIYNKVRRDHPEIGLVTIYRTIEVLSSLGLICEVHSSGGSRSYMRRPRGHHHHLICADCGRAVDFTECDLDDLVRKLAKKTGFAIEGHLLELYGKCLNCQDVVKVEEASLC